MESKTTEWRTAFAENMRMYRVIHFEKPPINRPAFHTRSAPSLGLCNLGSRMPLPCSGTQSSSGSLTLGVHACRNKKNTTLFTLGDGSDPALRRQNGAVTETGQPRPYSLQQTCIGRLAFGWSTASRAGELFFVSSLESHVVFS